MATVNGFGVVVEIVYVTLFLVFSPPRTRVSFSILMSIIIIYNHAPKAYCYGAYYRQ